jgi:hypothetical protein
MTRPRGLSRILVHHHDARDVDDDGFTRYTCPCTWTYVARHGRFYRYVGLWPEPVWNHADTCEMTGQLSVLDGAEL